ncbi:hypothetical protein FNQ90_20195 [Streptomyces alkaliphilus]|uniref:Uncharacterized protein n=1 Tax=Streptomyces alkaliphilus TaxID=1472722 RepID=A0A7W3Y322_9ACTN|nr:colicin immunity domain-containing protein [Streptomyces alkaliphilus]MBB0246369.1 hypothetical protein [Streptomyces alkaliphilus]
MQNALEILHKRPSGLLVFDSTWVDSFQKLVAPFPSGEDILRSPLVNFIQGVSLQGVATLPLCGFPPPHQASEPEFVIDDEGRWKGALPTFIASHFSGSEFEGILAYAEELGAALLYTPFGYTLVAGDHDLMQRFSHEGIDALKVKFSRYAKKAKDRHGFIREVTEFLPPGQSSWKHSKEVAPGSHVSNQLTLMHSLTNEEITPEEFIREWLKSRREAFNSGERVRGPLEHLLNEVFYALEDYEPDSNREPTTHFGNNELIEKVREILNLME